MDNKEVEELRDAVEKDEQCGRLITKLAYTAATLDDTAIELEDVAGKITGKGVQAEVVGIVHEAADKLNEVATDLKEAAKIMIDHVEAFE